MNITKFKSIYMGLMGLQHMIAMFGATILVPILSGLSVQVTLFSVGIGTLIFHLCSKGKVPAFLGSSFAFLVGIQLISDPYNGLFAGQGLEQSVRLSYATGAILVSGFVYLFFVFLIKIVGVKKFMKFMPPVVTAPTVILIGIMLAPFAINQSSNNIWLAAITLVIVIIFSSWGKGMFRIIPILLGISGAYIIALIMNSFGILNPNGSEIINFGYLSEYSAIGIPPFLAPRFNIWAIISMLPFAIATIAEHIGDMVALSTIMEEDLIENPGLHRTLLGDGLASIFAGIVGAPANTTYGENVGVVALTKNTNPRIVQIAAFYAIILGFSPIFAQIIYSIPTAIIGGASFVLYGMIAATGFRNLVDAKVDFSKTKNLTIVAIMLVTGLGLRFANPISFQLANINIPIDRLGIAIAVVLGILLNIILPDQKD